MKEIGVNPDPVFLLTVGMRDLVSQNGWNIFFDKTNKLTNKTYAVNLKKQSAIGASSGEININTYEKTEFSSDPIF